MSFRDWQVGDRVVCVDGDWYYPPASGRPWPLVTGEVYTIANIGKGCGFYRSFVHGVVIDLVEVKNPDDPYLETPGFNASRFRKVEPRKTDISVFERFLLNPNAPVREDA